MRATADGGRPGALIALGCLLALAALVVVVYLWTYIRNGYAFPVGPDAPVYLWWTRLAAYEGLSAVGDRPGVPALSLAVGTTLGVGPAAVVASLEIALTVAAALAVATWFLVGYGPSSVRWAWLVAVPFTAAFAAHLAAGYVATLAAFALVSAAVALVADGSRRSAIAGALAVGVAGLAQPQFGLIACVVFAVASVTWPSRRSGGWPAILSEHRATLVAAAGGLAVTGLGLAALVAGPPPLDIDTSRDDFLERAGLAWMLPALFRDRLIEHAPSFAPLASIPLMVIGLVRGAGRIGRIVRAWAVVLVAGGVFAFATGWFPPERFVTFALVVPAVAAVGLVEILIVVAGTGDGVGRAARCMVAVAVGLLLSVAFVLPPIRAWLETPPKIHPIEVLRTTQAGRYASASPPGTRLVFTASGRMPIGSFFWTEAGNAIRAAVPADRIRDVRIVLPGSFATPAVKDVEGRRLVELSARLAFAGVHPGSALWFDLAPFDRTHFGRPFKPPEQYGSKTVQATIVAKGVGIIGPHPQPVAFAVQPLGTTRAPEIAWTTVGVLALLTLSGYGWARAALGTSAPISAIAAAAPSVGAAALILATIVADRIGVAMAGWASSAVIAIAAVLGYVAATVTRAPR